MNFLSPGHPIIVHHQGTGNDHCYKCGMQCHVKVPEELVSMNCDCYGTRLIKFVAIKAPKRAEEKDWRESAAQWRPSL